MSIPVGIEANISHYVRETNTVSRNAAQQNDVSLKGSEFANILTSANKTSDANSAATLEDERVMGLATELVDQCLRQILRSVMVPKTEAEGVAASAATEMFQQELANIRVEELGLCSDIKLQVYKQISEERANT